MRPVTRVNCASRSFDSSPSLVACFVLWYGARVVEGVRFAGFVPGEGKRLILIAAAVAAVILPFTSALLWVRRREQRRVSPATGG